MKTCRDCEHFNNMPTIVDGECLMTLEAHHIDDECDYEISEKYMNFHKEVDDKIREEKYKIYTRKGQ